jgi:hypothetical protein
MPRWREGDRRRLEGNEMTPEERTLIDDLFKKLADLERDPRDADAERAIRDGLRQAPNAVYALVQTVLVQDEALRAANDHIAQLQDQVNRGAAPAASSGSFLGNRRDSAASGGGASKWNTGDVLRSSVPPVPPAGPPPLPSGYGRDDGGYGAPPRPPMGGQGAPWGAPPMGAAPAPQRGGGFLGTAAAAAAGAIGGSLLMGGIRNALGGAGGGGPFSNTFDHLSRGGNSGGGAMGGDNDLSRQAGYSDIGRSAADQQRQADYQQDLDQDQDDEQDQDDDQDLADDMDTDDTVDT